MGGFQGFESFETWKALKAFNAPPQAPEHRILRHSGPPQRRTTVFYDTLGASGCFWLLLAASGFEGLQCPTAAGTPYSTTLWAAKAQSQNILRHSGGLLAASGFEGFEGLHCPTGYRTQEGLANWEAFKALKALKAWKALKAFIAPQAIGRRTA